MTTPQTPASLPLSGAGQVGGDVGGREGEARPSTSLSKPCGTRGAAERHIRLGEPVDPACEQARRDYYAARQRRRRESDTYRQQEKRWRKGQSLRQRTRDTTTDSIAVERAIHGDAVTLTSSERLEVIRVMAARARSDYDIAATLRITVDAVFKLRTRHNIRQRRAS